MQRKGDALTLVKDLYADFAKGNREAALFLLHEAVTWEVIGPPVVPYCGKFCGRAGVNQFFGLLLETQHHDQFAPEEFIVDGEKVVVLGHERGYTKSTGKHFEARWAHVFECRDEQIISFREYLDTSSIVAALEP